MSLKDIFESNMQYFGELMGDEYDLLRPDYTAVDNTPITIASRVKFRCDPANPQFAEPRFREVEWYSVFGDRGIVLPGDILKKSDDDGMTPVITLAHHMPLKEMVGFRTTRLGTLCNTVGDNLHTNVRFDFLGVGYPGAELNKKLETTMQIPSTRVIIYKRINLIRLRTQLIETDQTVTITKSDGTTAQFQRKWLVEEIDYTGNCMVLTISNNVGK